MNQWDRMRELCKNARIALTTNLKKCYIKVYSCNFLGIYFMHKMRF
ncbi:hypothetical protein EUBDOL_01044 [Amedibacillus dolichus DSM 3991]|uniref:Uncharacterized protein n=1 Tax=Amedibacillus dolichus DSM 3991 TaxID=428127 RepID=A8RBB8_9FIRM|nr:hypothetical protein EUBDOL_01044 [Amedibacillus dolichus DSM 3991]